MRTYRVALFVGVLVGVLGTAYASSGPDLYIPYVDPERITLDGLGTEWEDPTFYPQDFRMTRYDLGGNMTGGDMPPEEDWDVVLYLGWTTGAHNMLYGYCRVTDDFMHHEWPDNVNAWKDDSIEIIIDADNSGGDYRTGYTLHNENAQQFFIRMTETPLPPGPAATNDNTQWFIYSEPGSEWMTAPEYFQAVLMYPKGRENVTYAYEW